jgi:hypothetical protein
MIGEERGMSAFQVVFALAANYRSSVPQPKNSLLPVPPALKKLG